MKGEVYFFICILWFFVCIVSEESFGFVMKDFIGQLLVCILLKTNEMFHNLNHKIDEHGKLQKNLHVGKQ